MAEKTDVAKKLIRQSLKTICIHAPCNHINCNRSAYGCVNESEENIVALLRNAFIAIGQTEWADAIDAANSSLADKRKANERLGMAYA